MIDTYGDSRIAWSYLNTHIQHQPSVCMKTCMQNSACKADLSKSLIVKVGKNIIWNRPRLFVWNFISIKLNNYEKEKLLFAQNFLNNLYGFCSQIQLSTTIPIPYLSHLYFSMQFLLIFRFPPKKYVPNVMSNCHFREYSQKSVENEVHWNREMLLIASSVYVF